MRRHRSSPADRPADSMVGSGIVPDAAQPGLNAVPGEWVGEYGACART